MRDFTISRCSQGGQEVWKAAGYRQNNKLGMCPQDDQMGF